MTLLSEATFEEYVGPTFPFSIIRYLHGTGKIKDELEEFAVEWALSVGPDGTIRFFVTPTEPYMRSERFAPLGFSGTSDDGTSVQAQRLRVTETRINSDNPNFTTLLHLLPESAIIFQRESTRRPALLKAHILNADLEAEEYVERDDRAYTEKSTMTLGKHKVVFFLNQHHKQLRKFARNHWLTAVCLSWLEVHFEKDETIQTALAYVEDIVWLTSFVCQQLTIPPVIDIFDDAGTLIYRQIIYTTQHPLHGGHLFKRRETIQVSKVMEKLYPSFVQDKYDINLRKLTGFLCAMSETTFVELRMSVLIMAYEHLLSRYLLKIGAITKADLAKDGFNVQQKLGRANAHLKFIPAELGGDSLRSVRNPLFHQGLLAFEYPEAKQIYDEYRDLLLRITLHLLDYDGYYCPPGVGPAKHVKTGESEKVTIALPPAWTSE